jgi:hypothetical protein
MNLQPILPNRYNPVRVPCMVCGTLKLTDFMVADLDGEPFKAFVCNTCVEVYKEGNGSGGINHQRNTAIVAG